MEKKKLDFLPIEASDPTIKDEDFKFVQKDKTNFEQKFQTKPTTFLKDSLKRFKKNKSSVVAAWILGGLMFLSLLIPCFGIKSGIHNTKEIHNGIDYLAPKLFKAGTGFWDGTRKIKNIPTDISSDPQGNNKDENWWPDPDTYDEGAIIEGSKKFSDEQYTTEASKYGRGGYVQLGMYNTVSDNEEYVKIATEKFTSFDFDSETKLTTFDVYDEAKLNSSSEETKTIPENYVLGKSAIYFVFDKDPDAKKPIEEIIADLKEEDLDDEAIKAKLDEMLEEGEITQEEYDNGIALLEEPVSPEEEEQEEKDLSCFPIVDYASVHNIGVGEESIDIKAKLNEFLLENELDPVEALKFGYHYEVRVLNEKVKRNVCVLIKSIKFNSTSANEGINVLNEYSFKDGNETMSKGPKEKGNWVEYTPCVRKTYLARAIFCTFVYDTYEAKLGHRFINQLPVFQLKSYGVNVRQNIDYEAELTGYTEKGSPIYKVKEGTWHYSTKSGFESKNPIAEEGILEENVHLNEFGDIDYVSCYVMKYKYDFKLDKMPKFILGTDKSGHDMLIYVFEGLRTSMILGIATTIICFLFGLLWGAVSGYFGGNVDLVMERLTDILSGIPWIVLMTLIILNYGSNFLTFSIALCLTGWIGTAATTRTQFYRFRGREYVLASRTLGASHGRLIAKHILPNAMGTIITSAVLMVPSVIFSEASISYLGLGLRDLSSLGVILSDNQSQITNNPFLLIFPSIIIALVMISFNLFGNGLRDAVNPSLKGEGE